MTDRCVTCGIAKRFEDTTNTFHLPFGKITITPFDFAVLTGLICSSHPLVYQEDFHHDQARLFELFGCVMENRSHEEAFPALFFLHR